MGRGFLTVVVVWGEVVVFPIVVLSRMGEQVQLLVLPLGVVRRGVGVVTWVFRRLRRRSEELLLEQLLLLLLLLLFQQIGLLFLFFQLPYPLLLLLALLFQDLLLLLLIVAHLLG